MKNCLTATLTQVANSGSTKVTNLFCGKRSYFPPSAECLKAETMAIMAGSSGTSGSTGWTEGGSGSGSGTKTAKETYLDANDFEFSEYVEDNSY